MPEEWNLDVGTAGASGQREYERRRANRQERTLERHPRIGKILLKFQEAPNHETAWAKGSSAERELQISLNRRCPEAIVLHDRRIPQSRANIDHLAVAPSGVHVIDTKCYKGKVEVRTPLFRDVQLFISGRDKTKLVDGLERQATLVRAALSSAGLEVPVHACFCFVNPKGQSGGTDLPLFRTLSINGMPLLVPRKLARRINQPGELGAEQMRHVAEVLAKRFPNA